MNQLNGEHRLYEERGRPARSFRRLAENIERVRSLGGLRNFSSARTSRRDADWGDRDGRDPHFIEHGGQL